MDARSQPVDVGFDEIVDAMSHLYRRRLLVALADHNPQDDTDAQEAAAALGAILNGEVDSATVEIELYHNHLPKLADEGFIVWHPDTGEIERGPNWEKIEPLIRLLRDHQDELPDGWL
jgi:hypothetical protein